MENKEAVLFKKETIFKELIDEGRPIEFVGVIMNIDGKEVTRRVKAPVPVYEKDMLEIEVADGLYLKLARDQEVCFGEKKPRAERRREEKILQKSHRLITLE